MPGGLKVRNASRTTIAPTGTLSIIAGCSSGIEPLFALSYIHNILDGANLIEADQYFEEAAKQGGFYSKELMEKLASGTLLHDIDGVPDKIKRLFVTAHEISPEWHVRMQAAFQKYTENAVSKTVNFSREATREDIAKVFILSYQEGVKGITIYRDGSREFQPLSTASEKAGEGRGSPLTGLTPRKRAKITSGVTEGLLPAAVISMSPSTPMKTAYVRSSLPWVRRVVVPLLNWKPPAGLFHYAAVGVRCGCHRETTTGIRCPSIAWEEGKSILSCADAIASVLEKHISGDKPKVQELHLAKNLAGQCPDCGSLLAYEEGCFKCHSCGYTKC